MKKAKQTGFRCNLVGVTNPDGSGRAIGLLAFPGLPPLECKAVFPPGFFPDLRRRGRPSGSKKTPEYIAMLAHDRMSAQLHPEWKIEPRRLHYRETVWKRAIRHKNHNTGSEARTVRTHILHAKKILDAGFPEAVAMIFIPEDPTLPATWICLENRAALTQDPAGAISINGRGWFCRWGDTRAIFGHLRTNA